MNDTYNQAKHAESRIRNGDIPKGSTLPVWLTNEGISSVDTILTYTETSELLIDIAKWAIILQDPATIKEKLDAEEDE